MWWGEGRAKILEQIIHFLYKDYLFASVPQILRKM